MSDLVSLDIGFVCDLCGERLDCWLGDGPMDGDDLTFVVERCECMDDEIRMEGGEEGERNARRGQMKQEKEK